MKQHTNYKHTKKSQTIHKIQKSSFPQTGKMKYWMLVVSGVFQTIRSFVFLMTGNMKNHKHGKPIVVGLLVLSIIVGMTVQDLSGKAIANLGYELVSHDGPVFEGDTLYAQSEVIDMRVSKSNPDAGIVKVETLGYNQDKEKILTLRRNIYIPLRKEK